MNDKIDLDVLEATSEKFRIDVDTAFQVFLANPSQVEYSFPANLNNLERKHIHQKAVTYNLISRSHGKDPNRTLTIYKRHNKSNFESFYIDISGRSQEHLDSLTKCYNISRPDSFVKLSSTSKVFGKFALGCVPPVAAAHVSPHIAAFQRKLPIYEMKSRVVETIRQTTVTIVSSETGSGKTTQIPQYIIDDCGARGQPCRVLCTQPRRISAVSVAERVAEERGSLVGEAVGYQVRLETRLGPSTNLIYCTNGVLIRNLMLGDGVLGSLTHVIIDEVHERDKLSDFLLICLRESLRKGSHIRLILMSATMNIEKFCTYFEGAAVLKIPGRLFCIKEMFLDDILKFTGYKVTEEKNFIADTATNAVATSSTTTAVVYPQSNFFDEIIMFCHSSVGYENGSAWDQLLQYMLNDNMPVNYQNFLNGLSALMVAVQQENISMVEKLCNLGADPTIKDKMGFSAIDRAEKCGKEDILLILNMNPAYISSQNVDLLRQYHKTIPDDDIDFDLLTKLICVIHNNDSDGGAILVFLPGYDDIMICNDRIAESNLDKNSYRVFFLHGSMNIKEQHEVFKPLMSSRRKIILSTNIAETSLTIDDVVFVIDSGKAKVLTYDSCSGLSALQTQWISKACVKQRRGRAGRTNAGMAFHLFSKLRYESFLDERIPEILRVPLEELCLNTKTLARSYPIYDFLVKAPDPPSPNTVKTAIENLECLGALDSDERLTPLGEYLSQLTIEPHLGKMLIYSAIFKCLDPVLTIVASLAQKDPFQLPPQANLRTAAGEKRKSLSEGTFSDHFVYLKVFMKWQAAVVIRKERQFCREFFISSSTMETILKTRAQLLRQLKETKFVIQQTNSMQEMNTFSENWALVKAVIAAGLYPKVSFRKGAHFSTRTEKKVQVHNSSALSKETVQLWMVYDELVKARNGNQIRGVTAITPITISLMCGIKTTIPLDNHMAIDDWLEFEFPNSKIIKLRRLIDNLITKKLSCPTNTLTDNDTLVLHTVANVLMGEEFAANMIVPSGIRHRPKFFELNRTYGNNRDPLQEILDDSFFNNPDHNERSSNLIGSSLLQAISSNSEGSERSSIDGSEQQQQQQQQQQQSHSFGAIRKQFSNKKPNYKRTTNHYRNGTTNGNYYGQNGDASHSGANYYNRQAEYTNFDYNYRHYNPAFNYPSNFPSHSRSPHQPTQYSNCNKSTFVPAVNNVQSWQQQDMDKSVFIIIKARKESNVFIAYDNNSWVFAASTEKKVVARDNDGYNVFLLYTVPEMNCFYGIAKFLSLDRTKGRPTAQIEWVIQQTLPFKEVRHLRNSLNDNRLVSDSDDGQEIDRTIAKTLWDLFSNSHSMKMGRPIRNLNYYN